MNSLPGNPRLFFCALIHLARPSYILRCIGKINQAQKRSIAVLSVRMRSSLFTLESKVRICSSTSIESAGVRINCFCPSASIKAEKESNCKCAANCFRFSIKNVMLPTSKRCSAHADCRSRSLEENSLLAFPGIEREIVIKTSELEIKR